MGKAGVPLQQEMYEEQAQLARPRVEEAYDPIEDFIPGNVLKRLLKTGGGLAAGALVPKLSTRIEKAFEKAPLNRAALLREAEEPIKRIRETFHPAFLNRIESTEARKGPTLRPKTSPDKDVEVYLTPKLQTLFDDPRLSPSIPRDAEPAFRRSLGLYQPVTRGSANIPFIGIKDYPDKMSTAVHEAAHVGFSSLRPTTAEVLKKSFLARAEEIWPQLLLGGDATGVHLLSELRDAKTAPGQYRALTELLSRAMQGGFIPSGPERHLLSPVGRALAEKRASVKLPDLPSGLFEP